MGAESGDWRGLRAVTGATGGAESGDWRGLRAVTGATGEG